MQPKIKRTIGDSIAKDVTDIFTHIVGAMLLCTRLVHHQAEAILTKTVEDVANQVQSLMLEWLHNYEEKYNENPLIDMDTFCERCVLATRDATEKILGVQRK